MVERCLVGWQEIEYEVMRDADDTCIAVCSMENVDPLGVHTGDSIVVAPVQTLTDAVHQRLRSAALAIIRALGVEGGCNVQFALSPDSTEYAVIEVNPRVSRSSALASKATGYPIARVAAQIAVGRRLAEIPNVVTGTTVAAFEPALDYVVVKLPRFPFDKFPGADRTLGSQMKATGEVMAIDRTFGSALNKALRGLEQAGVGPLAEDAAWTPDVRLPRRASTPATPTPTSRSAGSTRAGQACESHPPRPADRRARSSCAGSSSRPTPGCGGSSGCSAGACPEAVIGEATGISPWFLAEMGRNVALEAEVAAIGRAAGRPGDAEAAELLATVKRAGLRRPRAGRAWPARPPTSSGPPGSRSASCPGYAMVDTCAAEFAAETPVLLRDLRRGRLGARGAAGRAPGGARHRLGPGPDRPGHRVRLLRGPGRRHAPPRRLAGGDDQLEPGDRLDRLRRLVAALLRAARPGERPQRHRRRDRPTATDLLPAVVAFGGQTPLNLAAPLAAGGVPLLGSDLEAIDQAEERTRFSALLDRLGIPQPEGGMAHSVEEALTLAERIGYPVIVRPSFVIGGLAIDFCYSPEDLARQLAAATVVDPDRPVRIDRYLEGVEVDVDAVSDGERVLIPGLLEHVERAGVHSRRLGRRLPAADRRRRATRTLIVATMERIVLALGARGLVNAQFIVRDDGVYLIEVNPRASRTVPFMSKVTGVPMVELAVRISLGATLAGARLGRRAARRRRRSSRSRRRRSRRPSCAASTRRSGRGCSRPARSSASTTDPRVALAKALLGAALVPPRPGRGRRARAAVDRRPRQGHAAAAGRRRWRRPATGWRRRPGTRRALAAAGYEARPVAKLGEAADEADRRGRRSSTSSPRRGPARGQHADAALRARSATPPRSGSPRRRRGSCA